MKPSSSNSESLTPSTAEASAPPRVLYVHISPGGIPKRPIAEAAVGKNGIQGDICAHPKIHGGPKQALLIITNEGIEELKQAGYRLYPGALGENITTQGLDRKSVRLGQRYQIGEVIVQITKMRQPCKTLTPLGEGIQAELYDDQVKASDPSSPRWGLGGFYTSIVQTGTVRPGDPIRFLGDAMRDPVIDV